MSTLLYSLGRWSYRHPWRVLGSWLLVLAIAAGGALGLSKGFDNSFTIPGTESQEGLEQLERTFPQVSGTAAQFIVVAADGESVEDDAYREPIEEKVEELADFPGVEATTSPYSELVSGLISDDGTAAIVQAQFSGTSTEIEDDVKDGFADSVHELGELLPDGSRIALGGDLFGTELPTVTLTEALGVIIALLVLIVTFRSFVLAGLPLGVALIGVGVSMLGILAATQFATVSATTPLLALMLGLAVGIDYALFIAARHQDQVRDGVDPEESAARATGTAGSAVLFAGVTVLIALIGLGFAGIPFLTTMGIAAAAAVAIAVLIAVTLTPALLGFVKHRAAGRPRRTKRAKRSDGGEPAAPKPGFATRWVRGVTRHPVVTTVAVVLGLGVVAIPAGQLTLALPNAGALPADSEARQSYDLVDEYFGEGFNGPLILTGTIVTSDDPLQLMEDLKAEVEAIDGVKEVALAAPNETADTGIVQVVPETGPSDPATSDLVRELRAHHDEWLDEYGIDLKVTGFTAVAIDISDRLGAALLPFGIFVVGLSFILLMIVFRSIWVPVKAALGYLLSVLAAFGVVTAVFEWGWGADLLHVSRTGPVIAFMPIVVMGVLFGLAMDYEVFLVSRMREEFVHASRRLGATNRVAVDAVRTGFTASARVVTAAAIIMFAVFAAFVPEGDINIKPIALALAVGIAVDAFLVRMTLVPAVMTLLGRRAWWMPAWLERILPHFDIEGEAVERERELADWPEPRSTAQVAAEDLEIAEGGRTVAAGVSLRVEPGEAHVLTAPDPRRSRAVLLAIAARLAPDGGRLRVAGHLLPGRGAWVRAHVGVALLDGAADPATVVREALEGRTRLVVLDGLDTVSPAAADQIAAVLRDADRELGPVTPLTVVASARDVGAARSVLSDAGFPAAGATEIRTNSASIEVNA
ncbi:efflux RND transporter permease subunit [Microbacterium betulae]|uniref:Efflux RND transporter permease subunit n=1 Tax=Microbacterium betulae TaxID=2981139 RepID=A0AA97I6W9_9MICO|nr:efflux RND transporter permease subunit [Microbacterium sp. AB]WOF23607.1 efflux RND transporter permease subunit [Microbacterium sp. AB]